MSCTIEQWCTTLNEQFQVHADAERARGASAYMRNHFPFMGIDTPTRRRIVRDVVQECGLPTAPLGCADRLWSMNEREFHYAACDLLTQRRVATALVPSDLPRLERLIVTKSWWDTVDVLAPSIIGGLLKPTPDLVRSTAERWIASDNYWLQRSAILLQLKYREQTDAELLFWLITQRATSTEFFVRKASGWALRQYAYVAPDRVRAFVHDHTSLLSTLTVREATKHL